MQLNDTVEIMASDKGGVVETVPGHVYSQQTLIQQSDNTGIAQVVVEQIKIIIEPNDLVTGYPTYYRIGGRRLVSEEPPLVRRMHGEDHHLTITAKYFLE